MIELLRKRSKEAFLKDPLGVKFEEEYLKEKEMLPVNDYNMRIRFLEEVQEGHRGNQPQSFTDYKLGENLQTIRMLKQGIVDESQPNDEKLKRKTKRSQYERDKAANSSIGTELKTLGKETQAKTNQNASQPKMPPGGVRDSGFGSMKTENILTGDQL